MKKIVTTFVLAVSAIAFAQTGVASSESTSAGQRISLGTNAKHILAGGQNDDAVSLSAVAKYWF